MGDALIAGLYGSPDWDAEYSDFAAAAIEPEQLKTMRFRLFRMVWRLSACFAPIWLTAAALAASPTSPPPASIAAREFSWAALDEPEPLFWPAYLWLWNGPLGGDAMLRQLRDMRAHDARSVCTIPMPHEFRPDSTNNRLDPPYLSPKFFDAVTQAVDEAARLGMHYWMYDEGGWPSGQATGRILEARRDLTAQLLERDAAGAWHPARREGFTDLLNPETTATFIALTHERYRAAIGRHFGHTVQMVFTDEPAVSAVTPGKQIPWTTGADELFRRRSGYELTDSLTAFDRPPSADLAPSEQQARVDFFDFWSSRFRTAYFDPLRAWSRSLGLAHGGHLGGDDETDGCVRYGFGHVMRQLRAMDVPGVDIIWRQVFPGQRNHHFAKYASAAAHQNGGHLALTESFCVYGNGLTPAQMKWLIDYQYVRGLNLLVAGCYPLSTQDHLMPGERPHFGPVDPLWDFLPELHRYVARLGYVLACGEPVIDVALYYPVRDMWALGGASPAVRAHEELAAALFARQCDFDIIDDDVLADPATRIEHGAMVAGSMRYRSIVLGPTQWISKPARARLDAFRAAGGTIIRGDEAPELRQCVETIPQTIVLSPESQDLRVCLRRWPNGGAAFIWNEGVANYRGRLRVPLVGAPVEVLPATGQARVPRDIQRDDQGTEISVTLGPGQSLLLVFADAAPADLPLQPEWRLGEAVDLVDGWEARVSREHRIGEHDYELVDPVAEFRPVALADWKSWLGPDFSGRVIYRRQVEIPVNMRDQPLGIDLGRVDFAARVSVDGQRVGDLLWAPWVVALPDLGARESFELEVEVANTLANAITSQRTQEAWGQKSGAGWPGPYHARALRFEFESRSGGLFGPARLIRLEE
ncbi:MAG: hypothetical protein K1X74_06025 [Pirellulales bacterium]|nr:hypothetical protein [Pirellulales bacterium]